MPEQPSEANEETSAGASEAAARMKAAREAAGMSLKDVAEKTRVPLRHLQSLEEGDFGALPGTTYCAGFARAYARAVGMDEATLVAQLRTEIDDMGGVSSGNYEFDEPVNPARVPPGWLAWTAAILVLLLAGGYGLWRMQLMTPPTDEDIARQTGVSLEANSGAGLSGRPPAPLAGPAGPVVMTASDDVWLRIYQADGTRLFEGTLKGGESYTVPDNARDPLILTGRPDALAISVGGQPVPPLGTAERTISDVPVSAGALLERAQGPTAPELTPAVLPTGAVVSPTPRPATPTASPTSVSPATPAEASNGAAL